jgi:hypothetical protein
MTRELYAKVLKLNNLRRESALGGSAVNWSELHHIEEELAALKNSSGPEPGATVLSNRTQPIFLGPETTGLEVVVTLNMAQVPTSIVHLLDSDEDPLVTASIAYTGVPGDDTGPPIKRVRVSSYVEGYSSHVIQTIELRRRMAAQPIKQLPTFFPNTLAAVNELTRATLNITVEHLDSKELELQTTKPIWLLPRTTAVLELKDPSTGKWKDLSRYLAAYVTPNAPTVMEFLREAKTQMADISFVGYQGDPQVVSLQVEALFNALKKRGVSYVNSLIAFGDQHSITVQRVRLPRESLSHTNANCIDGAVLFASLLEAISLNASIVVLSTHAFVGWQSWPNGEWKYLETTMVGSSSFSEACKAAEDMIKQLGQLKNEVRLEEARTKYHVTPME